MRFCNKDFIVLLFKKKKIIITTISLLLAIGTAGDEVDYGATT